MSVRQGLGCEVERRFLKLIGKMRSLLQKRALPEEVKEEESCRSDAFHAMHVGVGSMELSETVEGIRFIKTRSYIRTVNNIV